MTKHTILGAVLVLMAATLNAQAAPGTAASISGTVATAGVGIAGIEVSFLDAGNAEVLATTATDGNGHYASGNIPAGDYRLRFVDVDGNANGGFFGRQFHGAGFDDVFCLGSVVAVLPGASATADEAMATSGVVRVVETSGNINGAVTDAATGDALAGVQVQLFNVPNAVALLTTETDADGLFAFKLGVTPHKVVIRYSDPGGAYFPSFFGASGEDDLCSASILTRSGSLIIADEALVLIPPDQLVRGLTELVQDMGLPTGVSNMLGMPLSQAAGLLTDDNPNNDNRVCKKLTRFLGRVEFQLENERLTQAQADLLTAKAETIQETLGCP